jgi:hypothetical protein
MISSLFVFLFQGRGQTFQAGDIGGLALRQPQQKNPPFHSLGLEHQDDGLLVVLVVKQSGNTYRCCLLKPATHLSPKSRQEQRRRWQDCTCLGHLGRCDTNRIIFCYRRLSTIEIEIERKRAFGNTLLKPPH